MGRRAEVLGASIERIVAWRFTASASLLAVLTAAGLFIAADVRSAAAWALYVLAAALGIGVVAWWVHRKVIVARKTPASAGEPRTERGTSPLSDPEQLGLTEEEQPPGDFDEVDYLMALRHEFRTPLNAVLGFSDVLLSGIDGEINASQTEDLEIIRASGIRLRVLLDSALDLSQLAEGELRLDSERLDLRELVTRVAAEAGQLWSNKRTAPCVLPDTPCIAEADEARLRRSILLLAEFLGTDHRAAEITLRLASSHDHFAIEVSAEGSDRLTLDALPTPAEVLESEDPAKIRQWPLAVTSEIIARHQGALYHGESPARFLIRLPSEEAR